MPMNPSLTTRPAPAKEPQPVASSGRIRATVDAAALQHNLTELMRIAPRSRVMPVIKADGYGHGAERVAHILESRVDCFAVAAISEALALREAGVRVPLCVLGGVQDEQDWACCVTHDFEPVVHAHWQWNQLRQLRVAPRYWLKFDSGMGRLGFCPADAAIAAAENPHRSLCLGLMTHLACADEPGNAHTREQLRCFASIRALFPELPVSIANSAAALAWPETHGNVIRPGLALYGVNPLQEGKASMSVRLRPAMSLEGRVMAVRGLEAGHSVGYGASWVAQRSTRIAIVAAGYADGVMRSLGSTAFHLIDEQGRNLPIRGRVSMDMIAVELDTASVIEPGDWLPIWGGSGMPVAEVAVCAGTLPYELLTALGRRVAHAVR